MERPYDIALFGATGFTGELTAAYLAAHLPEGARLALAGRNAAKLEAVRARLSATDSSLSDLPLLHADAADPQSLEQLAASARVVISTVGPYLLHGEPLVAACAHAGTDYVDLTGEPEFVDQMYLRYHAAARESGARLVHACGFDAIPADLGVLYTIDQIPDAGDVPVAIRGFVLAAGAISGGTYQSVVNVVGRLKESGRVSRQRRSVERNADDGRLSEGRRVRGVTARPHRDPLAGGWVVPAPTIDPQLVLRSARLLERYGPDFSYSHMIVTRKLRNTAILLGGVGALATVAQLEPTRRLLLRFKQSGTGPNEAKRSKSFFRVRFVADVGANPARRLITEVSGGDPGYGETSKMLAESALCLAFDGVPARGGQWTPAVALGKPLIDRLVSAGLGFRVLDQ